MKLPLAGMVGGLLLGIAATMYIQPETPAGAALLIVVATLVVTLVVLVTGKLRSRP